jgi:hypothetical protein
VRRLLGRYGKVSEEHSSCYQLLSNARHGTASVSKLGEDTVRRLGRYGKVSEEHSCC